MEDCLLPIVLLAAVRWQPDRRQSCLIITGRRAAARPSPIVPFGPFLAAAGWLALTCGATELVSSYLGLYSGSPYPQVNSAAAHPWRIALTGGIGSGKSTVSELFGALGVPIIDADQVARELVAPGEPLLAAVFERFGTHVARCADGSLDRASPARSLVFEDAAERRQLEAIAASGDSRTLAAARRAAAAPIRFTWFRCWSRPRPPATTIACWWWIAARNCSSRGCRRDTVAARSRRAPCWPRSRAALHVARRRRRCHSQRCRAPEALGSKGRWHCIRNIWRWPPRCAAADGALSARTGVYACQAAQAQ